MKRQTFLRSAGALLVWMIPFFALGAPDSVKAASSDGAPLSDQDVSGLGSSNPSDRKNAEERIQKAGPGAIPTLVNGLDDSNQAVRERAAWLLRQITYQFKSIPHDLVASQIGRRVHTEKDLKTRGEMIRALREYSGPTAVRELKRSSIEDSDWHIRLDATHFVARASADPSKEILFFRKQTTDSNKSVILGAYYELARLGDKSGRDLALQTISKSSDWYELTEAIQVLGETGNPADLSVLQRIADSKSTAAGIRLRALRAYKNDQLSQLRTNEQLDFLIKALDDPSRDIADWAYTRLWDFQDPNTTTRLKQYLSEKGHRGYGEAANALQLR